MSSTEFPGGGASWFSAPEDRGASESPLRAAGESPAGFNELESALRVARPATAVTAEEPHAAEPGEPPASAAEHSLPAEEMRGVPLGTIIFRAGLLTSEQIEDALRDATGSGRRLGQVLLERGWLDERDLARFLAGQKGFPYVDLRTAEVDREATHRLSEELARVYRALPIAVEDDVLVVAIADPTNDAVMGDVEAAVHENVRFAVAAAPDLEHAISVAFHDRVEELEPEAEPAIEAHESPADVAAGVDESDTDAAAVADESFADTITTREEPPMEPTVRTESPFEGTSDYVTPPAGPAQPDAAAPFAAVSSGGVGTADRVAVRVVLRSGQAESFEIGSFDDASRATQFAMALRRFLRPGTTISLDILDEA